MNRISEIIMASLRSTICADENVFESIGEIDKETLAELYEFSKKQDIIHIIGSSLEKYGLITCEEYRNKFEKQQFTAIYRYENQRYELDALSKAFEAAKIKYIPLKGAYIRDLYPEPWMRTSCDIDVLVNPEDFERAKEILINKLSYSELGIGTEHDESFNSPTGVHIELHFNVNEKDERLNHGLSRIWEFAYLVDGYSFKYALKNEFAIFYSIAHSAFHFLIGGCGIRPFLDLFLMKTKLSFDREVFDELCVESGVYEFAKHSFALSEYWFANGEGSEIINDMEDFIFQGGVYGSKKANIVVKQTIRGGRTGYIFSRIFVSYDVLKERYPNMKSRASLPFYQVRRWIDMARGGRFKRSVNELKLSTNIDGNERNRVGLMLKSLGLEGHIK